MSRSRIRNLDRGYRLCELCGRQYHWSTFCTCQIRAEVEAIKAEAAAKKTQAQQPAYDREWFQREVIDARMNDPHQHEDGQVSLPDMMLLTGRIDHAQWMALVWPTLPEIEY